MSEPMKTVTLKVSGMTCGSCRAHVSQALSAVDGVTAVNVDLGTGEAAVTFDPSRSDSDALGDAVRTAGYGAEVASSDTQS